MSDVRGMTMDDMIIVSIDDHICEPADMFDRQLPQKWRDRAPKFILRKDGTQSWQFEDMPARNIANNAVVGRPREELGFEPNSFEQIRKGCYEVRSRIDDMNVNGVLASINFPNFPGFSLELFYKTKDRDLSLALIKAYNDWHFDEWCAVYPERFMPLLQLPLWDITEAIAELKRHLPKGVCTVNFPAFPENMGLPNIHHEHWRPLWSAIHDAGIPISIHITQGGGTQHLSPESPVGAFLTKTQLSSWTVAAEWLWSRMPRDYPDLKIVLSEGGIGWIPAFLERADAVHKNHGPWMRQDWRGKLPSEVFREHFISCFIEDKTGIDSRHIIGIDNITFENDYPHADVTWPYSPEQVWKDFEGVPREDIDKIMYKNALRIFNFDPISKLGRENCTVGALRAQAQDVDLTMICSSGGIPPTDDPDRIITARDMARQESVQETA